VELRQAHRIAQARAALHAAPLHTRAAALVKRLRRTPTGPGEHRLRSPRVRVLAQRATRRAIRRTFYRWLETARVGGAQAAADLAAETTALEAQYVQDTDARRTTALLTLERVFEGLPAPGPTRDLVRTIVERAEHMQPLPGDLRPSTNDAECAAVLRACHALLDDVHGGRTPQWYAASAARNEAEARLPEWGSEDSGE
jgi:hypothetical protein